MTGEPAVDFATSRDGFRIAYAIRGEGPPLVYLRGLNSQVDVFWSDVWSGRYLAALARAFSVLLFDARGNGLSDPCNEVSLETHIEDLAAVVENAGLDSFALYGQGFGTPAAIEYAARNPQRIEHLILYCAFACGQALNISDEFIETMRKMPDAAVALQTRMTYPDARNIPAERFDRRNINVKPETAALYYEFVQSVDVKGRLASIESPTLIMQPERSPVVPGSAGKELAAAIPNATLVTVPTGSYNPWGENAIEPTLEAISAFTGVELPAMPASVPLAVLVTDIVGSTALRHRVGEEETRRAYREHDATVRSALAQHRGAHVKRTGDGVMASFRDVADAIACAVAIQRTFARTLAQHPEDQGRVRIGIAWGDVIEEPDDLFGTTVVLAVRINDRAQPGQILVSDAVREVASANGYELGRPRSVALKGFPGRVRVHEVRWTDGSTSA